MASSKDILATLAYYDIFNYPLTPIEIYSFLGKEVGYEAFLEELEYLISNQLVYKLEEFYSLRKDLNLVTRRRNGNLKARKLMQKAAGAAGILNYFPFVRGIAISGSLSKNFADENSDIDFFIITKKNKLWIARTLMHCFKKLTYLVNKQNYFCMNYYVDEQELEIEEKNIFTATEIATLIPLKGLNTFRNFNSRNNWVKEYFPNNSIKISYMRETKQPIIKKVLEFLLNNYICNKLEPVLMKITRSRWDKKTKQGRLNKRGMIMGLKISRHYSKPDPFHFQFKLVSKDNEKIAGFNLTLKNTAL